MICMGDKSKYPPHAVAHQGVMFFQKPWCLLLLFILLVFLICTGCDQQPGGVSSTKPLEEILSAGEIRVITRNNAHCYYFYREQAMGFEYDLAKAFAKYLGVRLRVQIADKWEGMIPSIMNRSGDFVAASMTITPKRQRQVAFSDGYLNIQQHIIVHRDNTMVQSQEDLYGKDIFVRKGTSYEERLEALQDAGIKIFIYRMADVPTEDLIRQVAANEIEITIADSNIAQMNRRYHPQIRIADSINDTEVLGWAVHPQAYQLRERINAFFKEIKTNGTFQKIYDKYYADIEFFDYVDLRRYHRRLRTRLPAYKKLVIKAAKRHGLDWRLIAAQIYQESHFDPKARSHAGAYGLMQLTASTARSLGVKKIYDPKQNIYAGVYHLKQLYEYYDQISVSDRLNFSLAAYNIGQGHISDARSLAKKMGLDPDKWGSLTQTLPLLRYHKYYKDATYGYCRGTEPLQYVKHIMIYYDILKRQAIEYTTDPLKNPELDTTLH